MGSLADRFWNKVDKSGGEDSCWNWVATQNGHGYGLFRVHHSMSMRVAHRVAYELMVGVVPDGLELDHLCRNRSCVNPSHLEPVTKMENFLRGYGTKPRTDKTRCPSGHPYSGENLYTYRGRRSCKLCQRAAEKRYRSKKAISHV